MTLAYRRLGLIVAPGNPFNVLGLEDLVRLGMRFVNRQSGSGTRVWLDAALRRHGIDSGGIQGYNDERMTHSEVAAAVAEGQADAGFGLEAVAISYGLDFIFLVRERYDLVIPAENLEMEPVSLLVGWLASEKSKQALSHFKGYEARDTGRLLWIG